MRTAELLEISSLCESQRNISGKFIPTNTCATTFSNSEKPTNNTKRQQRETSNSPPSKTRRVSGGKFD